MMPDYNFFVTEGAETQEILVGISSGHTGFVTQRTEFKAGNPAGARLTTPSTCGS